MWPLLRQYQKIIWRFFAFAIIVGLWQVLAIIRGNERLFPSIDHIVLHSFPGIALFAQSQMKPDWAIALRVIGIHSLITIARIVSGITIGALAGILSGLAVHFFKRSGRANALVLACIRAIPLMGLIPLFIYWFGNKGIGIPVYIAFGALIVVAPITYESVSQVPTSYIEQARVLGAKRIHRFLTVYPYAIQPQLFPAIRDIAGLSWAFSLGAEYIAARAGLGFLVYQSYLYADMGKLIFLAGVYMIYGFITYLILNVIFRRIGRWYLRV